MSDLPPEITTVTIRNFSIGMTPATQVMDGLRRALLAAGFQVRTGVSVQVWAGDCE